MSIAPPQLRRELTLVDAAMINLGTMVATGIFLVPADIARQLDSTLLVTLVWVVGGVCSCVGAMCLAEFAAAMPEAGGQVVYLQRAYLPVVGWLYGWTTAVLNNPSSIAAISVGMATYLSQLVPLSVAVQRLVAVGAILALTALNIRGVRLGVTTQNALTSIKLATVCGIVVVGLGAATGTPNWSWQVPDRPGADLALAFGIATIAAGWAYDGFSEAAYVGGEVKNPGWSLPRSMFVSVALLTVLYTLVSLALNRQLPLETMARSPAVAADAMRAALGSFGGELVAGAIVLAALGAANGIIMTASRVSFAMARQGLFFASLGDLHPRFRTPTAALLTQAVWASVLALSGTYRALITYVVFATFVFHVFSALGVIRLRLTRPDLRRPYRAWGYPWTPLAFALYAVAIVGSSIAGAPREAAVGTGFILAGLPAYAYWRRSHART